LGSTSINGRLCVLLTVFARKAIFIFILFSVFKGHTQVVKREYKKFTDTVFAVGDYLLPPEIQYSLGGCEVIPQCYDSVVVIVEFIKLHPAFKIEVGVHLDKRGDEQKHFRLTQCRANSVKNCIMKQFGVLSEKVVAAGYVSRQLLTDDDSIEKARSSHGYSGESHKKTAVQKLKYSQ